MSCCIACGGTITAEQGAQVAGRVRGRCNFFSASPYYSLDDAIEGKPSRDRDVKNESGTPTPARPTLKLNDSAELRHGTPLAKRPA